MLTGSLLALFLVVRFSAGEDPLVETKLGKISGSWDVSRSGRKFATFNAIPFAQPPIGQLRFQAPKPLEQNWTGVYNASRPTSPCPQQSWTGSSIIGSEDCLYLYVATHNVSGKVPVLVHIHGGGFAAGDYSTYRPNYLMDHDMVVISINYRFGILGFLSLEDDVLPGNQGMKDQVLALHWVQENIHNFGGDPDRVTIIGESAGGASVFHHTISPLSKGLFRSAIAESGSSYGIWAVAPLGAAKSQALEVMKSLNCSTSPKDALPCALNKSLEDILQLQPIDIPTMFGPVFEEAGPGAFLVGPIRKWEHNPVPLLMGVTSGEGLLKTAAFGENDKLFDKFAQNFDNEVPNLVGYFRTASSPQNVTNEIRRYYGLKKNITIKDWVNITNIFSDSLFYVPAIDGANNHTGPVYFYFFDYILKELTPGLKDNLIFGALHCTETTFIWKISMGNGELIHRPEDVKMSKLIVKIVANFVRNGIPNIQESTLDSLPNESWNWEQWTHKSNRYMHINESGFHLKTGFVEEKKKFWDSTNFGDKLSEGWNNSSLNKISALLFSFITALSIYRLS